MKSQLSRLFPRADEILYDVLPRFQPQVGRYYQPIETHAGYDTWTNRPANQLNVVYYPVFRKCRFDQIAIQVQGGGGAGAKIRLSIYEDKGKFYPGKLLLDAGEVSAEATGVRAIDIDVVLDVGRYWLAYVTNDATIDLANEDGVHSSLCLLWNTDLTPFQAYYASYSYGPLPSEFPDMAIVQTPRTRMGLRVKAVYG